MRIASRWIQPRLYHGIHMVPGPALPVTVCVFMLPLLGRMLERVILLLLILSGDIETNPGPVGQLTLEDLSEVRGALYEARAKWYDIGIELKLSIGTLNTIREDFPQAADCLREICIHWLKCTDPRPSWTALSVVLESPPVGEGHLAQRLRAKYCRGGEKAISHTYPAPVSSPPGFPPTSQVPFGVYESHHLPPQVHHTWTTPQAQFFTSTSAVSAQPNPSHPPSGPGTYYHPPAASYPTSTPFIPPHSAGIAGLATPAMHRTYSQLPPVPPVPTPSTPVPPTSVPSQPSTPQLATSHTVQTVATSQPPVQTSVATDPASPNSSIIVPLGTLTTPTYQPTTAHAVPLDKPSVRQHVKQFERRFCELVFCTYDLLADRGIEACRFHAYLMALDVSRSREHGEFVKSLFEPGTTFHNLWVKLSGYWNFLNFNLLEHVVSQFGSKDLERKMQSYVHDLQMFRSVTRLRDFVDCWPVMGETPPKADLRMFIVKMELDWDRCTLEDLETFKGVITHKFFLPDFALQLQKIQEGSIIITWSLPTPFVKALQQSMTSTANDFFIERKIAMVIIDGQECHPSPISGYVRKQDTSEQPTVSISPRMPAEKLHPTLKYGMSEKESMLTKLELTEKPLFQSVLRPSVHKLSSTFPETQQLGDTLHMTSTSGYQKKVHIESCTPKATLTHFTSPHEVGLDFPSPAEKYVAQKCVDEVSGIAKLLQSVEQYLSKADVEADPSLPNKYRDYLSSTPAIRAAMCTPFSAKTSAEVFAWSQLTQTRPPTTMTELLTTFTLKTLVGYLSTHPLYRKQQLEVTSLGDLPPDVYKQFLSLCRMAYKGILNRQQLVFSATHLPTGFSPLGLMQEVPQVYTQSKASSYHFTHLTLQEFLSAIYISQLPKEEQKEVIQYHLDSAHFKMTLRFLAGLTNIPPEITKLREGDDDATLLHWLFECKDTSMTTKTLGSDQMFVSSCYSWTPLDYYVTGHVISHSNCPWRLDFSFSSIDEERFELFCQGCAAPGGAGCEGYISSADFNYSAIPSKHMQSFVSISPHILQGMTKLCLNGNKLDASGCNLLAKVVPSMSRLEELRLGDNPIGSGGAVEVIKSLCGSRVKGLSLYNTEIGGADCEALSKLLQSTHSLEWLHIKQNNLSSESVASIITGLSHNSSLTDLDTSNSHFSLANMLHLSSLLRECSICTLTSLEIRDCHISSGGAVELVRALCKNTTLNTLVLSGNPVGDHVEGVAAIATLLIENKSLTRLEIQDCNISGEGAGELAAALYKNSTLQYLKLDLNPIGVEGASSMSDMLQHNTSLTWLSMCDDSVVEEGDWKYKSETSDQRIWRL